MRHIGLRLVVVVIGHKVLHRISGEELPHLGVQLSRQGLVGRQNQCRAAEPRDDIGHGEGLARTRHPEQCLKREPVFDALD